jgi:hypothetical protein
MPSGLHLFEKHLLPTDVGEIRGWSGHAELSVLLGRLESMKKWEQFLDCFAEAKVALHLIRQGFELQYEVPTVNGLKADFRASRGTSIVEYCRVFHVRSQDRNSCCSAVLSRQQDTIVYR